MGAIAAALEAESPNTGRGAGVAVVPLREQISREPCRRRSLALLCASGSCC